MGSCRSGRRSGAGALLALCSACIALPTAGWASRAEGPYEALACHDETGSPTPSDPPGFVASDWLSSALREIARREYRASRNPYGLQAPNRAHDLRTYFEPWGIRVVDREDMDSPELLALRLAAIGRGSDLAPVGPGSVESEGARVEIARPGIVEWYENSQAGLEQGFTLPARPPGDGSLVLEISVGGAPSHLEGGRVVFDAAGRRLAFGKLAAVDAEERRIAVHFELPAPDRLQIVVADEGAVYPVVIDPLLSGEPDIQIDARTRPACVDGLCANVLEDVACTTAADCPTTSCVGGACIGGAREGMACSSVADCPAAMCSAVGEMICSGGSNDGQACTSTANCPGGSACTRFCKGGPNGAVCTSDADCPAPADGVLEQPYFTSPEMGVSVAGAGDVNADGFRDVIVGARFFDAGQSDEGAAFVFHGGPTGVQVGGLENADTLLASDQLGAEFGFSVAGDCDVNGDGVSDVIVGARRFDDGQSDEGAAFVFHGAAGTGVASGSAADADTRLQSDQGFALLGASVACAGNVNGDLNGANPIDDVLVGAPFFDGAGVNEGAAFLFLGSPVGVADGTAATAATHISASQTAAFLGSSVAGAGDVNADGFDDIIVGSEFFDLGQIDEGAAFVFLGSAAGIPSASATSAHAILQGDQASAQMGFRVAGAGDVNNDTYDDVIVGAGSYDSGEANARCLLVDGNATPFTCCSGVGTGTCVDEGAAFVFHGGPGGIAHGSPETADTRFLGDEPVGLVGQSVAGAGDVNADGFADVIIGASRYDNRLGLGGSQGLPGNPGITDQGAAFVLAGGANGIPDANPKSASVFATLEARDLYQTRPTFVFQVEALFGSVVGGTGDVNGDGFDDVIVGARDYQIDVRQTCRGLRRPYPCCSGAGIGSCNEGAAFVFLGSKQGFVSDPEPDTAIQPMAGTPAFDFAEFGFVVANAGNVDGDTTDDVIIGAPFFDGGLNNEGAAFVFLGSASGISETTPDVMTELMGEQAGARFGSSVAGAGDVDDDGLDDIIVGAPFYDNPQVDEGVAFVFSGGTSVVLAQLEADQAGAGFGTSVAGAGNVDGDEFDDVIVGAPLFSNGQSNEGAAYVFLGDALTSVRRIEGDQAGARFGTGVGGAGDVNADGFDDVIVGAIQFSNGQSNEGGAFVFHGSDTGIPATSRTAANSLIESNNQGAQLGASVTGIGDFDADGYGDVIAGAPRFSDGSTNEGGAFVFRGSASGIRGEGGTGLNPTNAALAIQSNQAAAELGTSVAAAGDVNGDGRGDVLVGAPLYDLSKAKAFCQSPPMGNCVGGADAGETCTSDSNCAGGVCGGFCDGGVFLGATCNGASDCLPACIGVCSGGANAGLPCTENGNCPGGANTCINRFCNGGLNDGLACTGIGGCPDTVCEGMGTCAGGANAGMACTTAGNCPGSFCDGLLCTGGRNDGEACQVNGDCFGVGEFPCSGATTRICSAGQNAGMPCTTATAATDCPGSNATCIRFCQGGSRNQLECASDNECTFLCNESVVAGDPFECCTGELTGSCAFREGAAFLYLGRAAVPVTVGPIQATATFTGPEQPRSRLGQSVGGADVNGDGLGDVLVGAPLVNESGESSAACSGVDTPFDCCTGQFTGTCESGEGAAFVYLSESDGGAGETIEIVPEPAAAILIGAGAGWLAWLHRRRRA